VRIAGVRIGGDDDLPYQRERGVMQVGKFNKEVA